MILEASGISKNYYQGNQTIQVLNNLNLSVSESETVCILGRSGSGKSTLLSLLAGLDRADSGSLNLLGENLFTMNEEKLTRFRGQHLGIVFQHFHLLPHLTALENVSLPLEILNQKKIIQRSMELLDRVGLSNRASHLPAQLSGGEMQRVALVRALVASPDVILADEPSGSLDESNAEEVIQLLFDLIKDEKKALILVTHDLNLSSRCMRRLELNHGVLSAID